MTFCMHKGHKRLQHKADYFPQFYRVGQIELTSVPDADREIATRE